MQYRREIDGLRTLAVIPVILFHAGFETFSGGYVGVDIFFVISGYLITSIILNEKEKNIFSLVRFYERRARRILPALFFVLIVSLPFAWCLLLPTDMETFAKGLISVSTYSSNILFWRETGYWGTTNELNPLLHTWSLAVEEQYYILFPLFLMLMWRFRKRTILVSFFAIAISSLALSEWAAFNKPSANFFILPTRGWELAIGANIAFILFYRPFSANRILEHKFTSESAGIAGLIAIAFSIHCYDSRTPFPGLLALAPTLGTALIITFSNSTTFVGRLLSHRLLVGLGLISYSAYLWHQPLFAFSRHHSLAEPNELQILALTLLTFPLAFLSWKYIEFPFRSRDTFSRKSIFGISIFFTAFFILLGIAGINTHGFENRAASSNLTFDTIQKTFSANTGLDDLCDSDFNLYPECRTSDQPEILVWGDSFAMHIVQSILSSKPDARVIQMTKSACGPFVDIAPVNHNFPAKNCLEFNSQVLSWLKSNKMTKFVVLSSPLVEYLADDSILQYRDGYRVIATPDIIRNELLKTLKFIEKLGVTPVLISPTPSNGTNLGRCLVRSVYFGGNPDNCNFYRKDMLDIRVRAFRLLDDIKEEFNIIRIDDLICDEEICHTQIGSVNLYRDGGHLTKEGATTLGQKFDFYEMITSGKTINKQ